MLIQYVYNYTDIYIYIYYNIVNFLLQQVFSSNILNNRLSNDEVRLDQVIINVQNIPHFMLQLLCLLIVIYHLSFF